MFDEDKLDKIFKSDNFDKPNKLSINNIKKAHEFKTNLFAEIKDLKELKDIKDLKEKMQE